MENVLQVVNAHRVVTLEDYKIVTIPFMVAEEKILAMRARKISPVGTTIFNGGRSRVLGIGVFNA